MPRALKYILIFIAILAVVLFFMPLRVAVDMADLEDSSFSAQAVTGSVWNGRIEGAQIGAYPLGDLDASVQALPLLAGAVKLDLERSEDDPQGGLVATIGKQDGGLFVENATTTIGIGRQLAPLPASNIQVDDVNVSFADGRCRSASGQVRIALDANIPGLDLQQGLLGNAVCQDGALVLPLKSASAMESLTLKLEGTGNYSGRLFLSGGNRAWTLLLPALGFRRVPDGYAIFVEGQIAPQ